MEYPNSLRGPWPNLAPPREAVHLRQSYDSLRSQLLPSGASGPSQPLEPHCHHAADKTTGSPMRHPSLATPLRLQRAPGFTSTSYRSKKNTLASEPGGEPHGRYASYQWGPVEDANPSVAVSAEKYGALKVASNKRAEATTSSQGRQGDLFPRLSCTARTPRAPGRACNSVSVGKRPLGGRQKASRVSPLADALGMKESVWGPGARGPLPPEVESVLLRLQHRSCSDGGVTPFSWRRPREREGTCATAVRSSSSGGGAWMCDGDTLVTLQDTRLKALRAEALERVRQRARDAREKQKDKQRQLQLQQQRQQQRSQFLTHQLRQRTLQRIRENSIKQEEQRQKQLQAQQQLLQQAEAQRQYCARHRKALQQRLLQQQQAIKNKIRMHAEESVRHSMDAKARTAKGAGGSKSVKKQGMLSDG